MTFMVNRTQTSGITGFLLATFASAKNKPNSKYLELHFKQVQVPDKVYDP